MSDDDKHTEIDFLAGRLVDKVWQGNQDKLGLARQVASVAIAALNDYTAQRYMETADQFTGEDIRRAWLAGRLAREARAVVLCPVCLNAHEAPMCDFPEAETLLAAIDNALRNGSYMTNANLAFEYLCDRLGVERDALEFDPRWSQKARPPEEFFEEDEPVDQVVAAFERGQHELTRPPGEVIPASPELIALGEELARQVASPPELGDLESLRRSEPSEDADV